MKLVKAVNLFLHYYRLNKTDFLSVKKCKISTILFLGVACVKGQDTTSNKTVTAVAPTNNEIVTAVAATKMNVLYVGVDNPVKIAVSGYESSEIEVVITNGIILGENGDYIIRPKKPGNMILVPSLIDLLKKT